MKTLPDLFGSKGADAIQAKAENQSIFLPHADVEGVILRRYRAAVPTVAHCHSRTHERAMISRMHLEVEEERGAAEQPAFTIAEKDRRTPLRPAQCPGLFAARISKLGETRYQFHCAGVVKALKDLHQ